MNTCNIMKEELVFYCYEELSPKRSEEIKSHLVVCRQCREEIQRLEKTILLIKQQKLKKIPSDILNNYTRQIKGQLSADEEKSLIPAFKEKALAWLENLRLGFYPQLMPAIAIFCLLILVFAFMQYGKINNINLINQDIALLEELGEDTQETIGADLNQEIENSGLVILAQLKEETDWSEVLDAAEIIEELDEEIINSDDISEDLQIIDDLEIESANG